jgi:hypothetical protein
MAIEHVRLPTADPLALAQEDYALGEVTTLYLRRKSERWLLMAVVELLPPLIEHRTETPSSDDASCLKLQGGEFELNLRRSSVPVARALEWYRAVRQATGAIELLPAPEDVENGRTVPVVTAGPFDEEPPHPLFAYEQPDFWGAQPLWGDRPGGTRWRWGTPRTGALPQLSDTQRAQAATWLLERLFVDVFSRPALLGSIHLRLPNPVFRAVRERLTDGGQQLQLEVTPYPGRSLDTLTVQLIDHRPMGPVAVWTTPLRTPRTRLELPAEPHMLQTHIWCERRGLLYSTEPTPFIGSIHLGMNMVTGTRRVSVPSRSKRRTAENYDVRMVHHHPTQIGEGVRGALKYVLEDRNFERGQREAERSGQRLFNDDTGAAISFVRQIIGRATKSVRIVDPYFGLADLMSFGLANATTGVTIQVLTSAEYLRNKNDEGNENGTLLWRGVETIRRQSAGVEIRVGLGDRAPIHDRFLILDDDVWLLGSSLNEFGSRGTMAVKVPHPPPVLAMLEAAWGDADPLEKFVSDRERLGG